MTILLEILLAVGASFGTVGFSLFLYHSRRKEEQGAAAARALVHEEQTKTLWRRLDDQREEVQAAKTELAVLRSMVGSLPNHAMIRGYIEALEVKLERRLDTLSAQIQSLFEQGR